VACNFNNRFENEGFLKVTGCQVLCKCGNTNISETAVSGGVVVYYYKPLIGSDIWPIRRRRQ